MVMPVLVSRNSQRRFSTARMRDMLSVCQGAQVSPYQPSFGDIDQHLGALLYKQPNLVAEDFFVADEDAERVAAGRKDYAAPAVRHVAGLLGEVLGKGEEMFVGDVFAPGHEVDFVVAAFDRAVGIHEERGVIHVEAGAVRIKRGVPTITGACMVTASVLRALSRRGSLSEERRGGFRPDDDPGRDRLRRTVGTDDIELG